MKRNTFLSVAALAAGAVPMAAQAQEAAEVVNKGDVAWMMTASLLVMFMIVPGLALFYGGLVRTKNMLSVLMQTTLVAAMAMVAWVLYGYSFAFGGAGTFWGGLDKLFLSGVTLDSTAATFTDGVVLPEYVFIAFQMTFAAITPALIIGAFAERIKFSATLLFSLLWITFIYFPIAHMVWGEGGLVLDWGA
ncbi:MAG: ammonia channel protein, partial [Maritimibacter sp.]